MKKNKIGPDFLEDVMKLEGLKVIDLSLFLPGPAVTLMMADHGARSDKN